MMNDWIDKIFKNDNVSNVNSNHWFSLPSSTEKTPQQKESFSENSLTEKEKLAIVGSITRDIGHELRSPLQVLDMAMGILEKRMTGNNQDVQLQRQFQIAKEQLQFVNRTISNMVEYSKSKPNNFHKGHINRMIQETLKSAHLSQNIDIQFHLSEEIPENFFEVNFMKQAIENLLHFASESMPSGGKIEISTKMCADDFIEIKITDTGYGVPHGYLESLLESNESVTFSSTRLAMALVRKAMELHKGTVSAQSKMGQGSTYILKYPIYHLLTQNQQNSNKKTDLSLLIKK